MLLSRLLLAIAALLALGGAAQARPFTARDLVGLHRVGDPHVSPDGRTVAYDLRSTDLANNKGVHAVWLLQDGRPRKLADDATAPRWSADGRAVYVLSGRSGSDQVWRVGVDGGAPEQVTRLPLDVGAFRVSPDGRTLVVSMAVFPDCETPACTAQRMAARKADKASGQVFDRLFIRHWDAWADGTRNHLFAVALGGRGDRAVALMAHFDGDTPSKPFGGDEDFALSPDGKSVYFSVRTAGRIEPWSTNFDIWRAPADGSAPPAELTAANPAWDAEPVVSPDGRTLAYRAQTRPGFESDRFGVRVMDLATGRSREVAPTWDRSAGHLAWTPDGAALIVTADDLGTGKLFRIEVAGGAVRPLTGAGHVSDYDVGPQGVVYAADAFDRPADLWTVSPGQPGSGGSPRQLTHVNAERLADMPFSPGEPFVFPGWNGEPVHGYLFKPTGYQPGRKYPVAFLIHGGPQGSWNDGWSYRWNPQTYTGLGYGVVVVDFHGSTGYGQAFTDAISGHWGDRPLEDLQKGWAAALARAPYLDGGRACALGASYGGFMIDWMAGVWNTPWKCLVVHDGVFDSRMMAYSTEEQWFSEWENGGAPPWRNPQGFERFNPISHVAQWTKPILVIHSGKDFRIPVEQGIAAFTAAQSRNLPSRFLTFPDENHWVLKPQNSLQWHATVEVWLKRWTGG